MVFGEDNAECLIRDCDCEYEISSEVRLERGVGFQRRQISRWEHPDR